MEKCSSKTFYHNGEVEKSKGGDLKCSKSGGHAEFRGKRMDMWVGYSKFENFDWEENHYCFGRTFGRKA